MSPWTVLLVSLAAAAVGGFLGWLLNNRFGKRSLEAAHQRIDESLRGARREAEKIRREALLQAKQEVLALRTKEERDMRSRKGQLSKRERELKALAEQQAEAQAELEQGRLGLAQRATEHEAALAELGSKEQELAARTEETTALLERVSGMTREEALRQLKAGLRAEARLEAAATVKRIRDEAQKSAETEATKIIALAVERAASEFSAERTVSQFELPAGSELKGRIIGQDGKNIRAFEQATGIQLLIDEEHNAVTLSGYNPVRREIARRVLETLVQDGNIHPKRIDELTRRKARRLDDEMRREGQVVLDELEIRDVHPEFVRLLGRLHYRTSYGQNVLLHSKEVAYITGMLAAELRLDEKLARRAGLFHDIGKAIDYEREGTHPEIGAELAEKHGEPEVVINAIASHHEDCEATSPISVLVAAADAISGARPGARRKSVAEYIRRIEKLEEMASSMPGVEQSYAIQAGREIRVIASARQLDDAKADLLATDLAARIQSEMDYPGKIKVTVIREVRAVDYAH